MEKSMGFGWGIFVYAAVCVIAGVYGIFWMPANEGEQKNDNKENQPLLELEQKQYT